MRTMQGAMAQAAGTMGSASGILRAQPDEARLPTSAGQAATMNRRLPSIGLTISAFGVYSSLLCSLGGVL